MWCACAHVMYVCMHVVYLCVHVVYMCIVFVCTCDVCVPCLYVWACVLGLCMVDVRVYHHLTLLGWLLPKRVHVCTSVKSCVCIGQPGVRPSLERVSRGSSSALWTLFPALAWEAACGSLGRDSGPGCCGQTSRAGPAHCPLRSI